MTAAQRSADHSHAMYWHHALSQVALGQTQTSQAKAQRFKASAMQFGLMQFAQHTKRMLMRKAHKEHYHGCNLHMVSGKH